MIDDLLDRLWGLAKRDTAMSEFGPDEHIAGIAAERIESLTAEVERAKAQPRITPKMAQMLLDAAQAHYEDDFDEVYHQIRIFAHELTDDAYDSWKALKEIAAADNQRRK